VFAFVFGIVFVCVCECVLFHMRRPAFNRPHAEVAGRPKRHRWRLSKTELQYHQLTPQSAVTAWLRSQQLQRPCPHACACTCVVACLCLRVIVRSCVCVVDRSKSLQWNPSINTVCHVQASVGAPFASDICCARDSACACGAADTGVVTVLELLMVCEWSVLLVMFAAAALGSQCVLFVSVCVWVCACLPLFVSVCLFGCLRVCVRV